MDQEVRWSGLDRPKYDGAAQSRGERLSAIGALRQLEAGETTSRHLVEMLRAKHESIHERINALVEAWWDDALVEADQADLERSIGRIRGPLHGLPISVKITFDVAGRATTAGTTKLKNNMATRSADAVQRLQQAGCIVFGKSNAPELASDWQTDNMLYGRTNNPWNPNRTAGGSSGGSAAALCAGLTYAELGSDWAGSLRIPAHYCGIYSMRPTQGRVSMRGHVPAAPGSCAPLDLATAGPMAHNLDDLEILYRTLINESAGVEQSMQHSGAPDCRGTHLRLAWCTTMVGTLLEDQQKVLFDGLREQLMKCEGVRIVTQSLPDELVATRLLPVYMGLLGAMMRRFLPSPRAYWYMVLSLLVTPLRILRGQASYHPDVAALAKGLTISHHGWQQLDEARHRMSAVAEELFTHIDVICMPCAPTTAPPHDRRGLEWRLLDVDGHAFAYSRVSDWCAMASALGLPVVTIPVGLAPDGMPVGMQIIGGKGSDLAVIRAAKVIEALIHTSDHRAR